MSPPLNQRSQQTRKGLVVHLYIQQVQSDKQKESFLASSPQTLWSLPFFSLEANYARPMITIDSESEGISSITVSATSTPTSRSTMQLSNSGKYGTTWNWFVKFICFLQGTSEINYDLLAKSLFLLQQKEIQANRKPLPPPPSVQAPEDAEQPPTEKFFTPPVVKNSNQPMPTQGMMIGPSSNQCFPATHFMSTQGAITGTYPNQPVPAAPHEGCIPPFNNYNGGYPAMYYNPFPPPPGHGMSPVTPFGYPMAAQSQGNTMPFQGPVTQKFYYFS